ncbi:FAD:protein FMN transferase [Psychroflexus planctonicus]|uniref:FAD:protein FMN transferase n=1 Tax=Psychroflexus planctonicus TaxID=1526575 RepID=A0ABQ1SHF6_9FLAO|nr:FAD:protein FMN transferase [Psychroflexus planctonicus]GGE35778.1 FAD:protein FMN transferase [Psychroflexus planctonicus]
MKKIYFLCITVILFSCELDKNPSPQVYSGNALGTTFQIQFFHENELEIAKQIDSTFTVLNQSLSTYIPTSDISKINHGDSTIVVDQQFVTNFNTSKQIFEITDGYFDPSVGILVNAYGFGPVKYNIQMNDKNIDSLMTFVGFDKVIMDANNHVIKKHPKTFLDFNSIAKGFAVDRLAALLDQLQVEDYLVEVGGELVASGKNLANNSSWRVGIDKPSSNETDQRELLQFIVQLENRAMATSGNYRKFKTDSLGNKFVHTINPKTGKSEASDILSATVFTKNCMTADAYATAFMAMGFDKTIDLIPKLEDIDVILIHAKGQEVETYISDNLADFIID